MKTKVSRGTKQGAKRNPPVKNPPVKTILLDLGDKIRKSRQDKGMTFGAVSKLSGVSTLYISNLEKGKYDNIGLEVLYNIAEAVGLELSVSIMELHESH